MGHMVGEMRLSYDASYEKEAGVLAECARLILQSFMKYKAAVVVGDEVAGALFCGVSGRFFSAGVVVNIEHRKKGYGRLLAQEAMYQYKKEKDSFGSDLGMYIDAIHPASKRLCQEFGLVYHSSDCDLETYVLPEDVAPPE